MNDYTKNPQEGNPPLPKRHVLGRPSVYRIGTWGIGYLPTWFSYWCVRRIAEASYLFGSTARKNVKDNLRRVFPNIAEKTVSKLALNTFRNYSEYLVDYGRFKTLGKERLFEVLTCDGMEHIHAALARGNGVIVLTIHMGNWELGGMSAGKQGIKTNVVTAHEGMLEIDAIKERYRKRHNVNTLIIGDSPFSTIELLAALRRNEMIAMLVDRSGASGKGGNITVGFFNRPFPFPKGPLILSRMTGAAIIPSFVVKEKGAYRSINTPALFAASEEEFTDCARRIMLVFEDAIRRYPDQWYNFVKV
ncbi:MAG: lysophospholipid acyltransferase family protein [Deltaproteobacteria bacterium]|nr:lysophospholipid acyltransferase family protein [Deltaproteobacteria bacterium]